MHAQLHITAFTRGKKQLSVVEVEDTRKIANVKIHLDWVIGCIMQKYKIFQGTLPIGFVCKRVGQEIRTCH